MQAQPMKFLIAVMVVTLAQGGKILIKPFGQCWGSHLLNLEFLAGFLVDKGHEVYFIAPSRYAGPYNPYAKNFKNKVHLIKYTTPEFEMEHSFQSCDTSDSIDNIRKESPTKQLHYRMSHEFSHCKALFMSTGSLKRIKNLKADLVITDSLAVCGSILATYLDIPYVTVDMVPGSHRSVWDLPHTPYLPSVDMPFSDQMTLMERVQNSVSQYFLQPIQNYIFRGYFLNPFRELLEYCNLTDVTLTDLVNHGAAYRIYNTDFSIEYPSPLLPNMAFIGGFFNTGSRPLEKEVTLFLQDVEEKEGLVIVSMGSRTRYDIQWGNLFAKALAQLPCKVIWRHIPDTNDLDDFPSEHGKNTMIVKWLPQRELLSNPKTKLFVTHAGAGSMFEAVYHGVPVLTIPLIADQPHQAKKLTDRLKMGTYLEVSTLTADSLHSELLTVLNNTLYAENAKKASKIFRLSLEGHGQKILSVINSAIAAKGAMHLQSKLNHMSWYQYYSVDVILVVVICLMLLPMPLYICSRFFSNMTVRDKMKVASKND